MEFKIHTMDDIVDVVLKAEQYQYLELKQRTIQKLKNIMNNSKSAEEARILLCITTDFTKEEEDFYCHTNYWLGKDSTKDLSTDKSFLDDQSKDVNISDVMINPQILIECGKHLYYFLRKRKLLKLIDDTTCTHCENCKCTFTMIYRKHHCRSCGKVFCATCCHKKIIVPKEFLSFHQYSIFNYFSSEERVCDVCYLEIFEYHTVHHLIRFFNLVALEIPLLQRAATISKPWRRAILFYLSQMREVQYKLLHLKLEDSEKNFLFNNRNILCGHSSWMLQLMKIEVTPDMPSVVKSIGCWDAMCTRLCHEQLDIFDAFVILVLDGKYSIDVKSKAIELFDVSPIEKWIYLLPFLFSKYSFSESLLQTSIVRVNEHSLRGSISENSDGSVSPLCDTKLFDLLIKISKNNPKIYSILYWGLSVCSFSKSRRSFEHMKERLLLESPTFSKTFIGILHFLSHCEDFYKHRDVNILSKNLGKFSNQNENNSFFCPIRPDKKIKKILTKQIKIKTSITTPIYIPYECEDGSKAAILFKKEDIRKDATAMGMARLCQKLLEVNGIQVPFISYEVVPTSPTSGFIEIVQQSKTLHEIFQEGTINNYLQIHNPEKKFGEILENYMKSLAFWTIFTYLLGVGDRHLENIMLTSDGVLFHIDYGFILGYETKPYVPLIRIDNSILEGIGGNVQYEKFKSICIDMFLCLRRYSSLLFCCFITFASCDPPIQNTKFTLELLENHIVDRFLLGQSETDVSCTISKLIDNSRDAVTLKVSDYIHTYASKIPSSKGILSWWYPKK